MPFVLLWFFLLAWPAIGQTLVESSIKVSVTGQVRRPGLYTLPHGARAIDAISAAGGTTPRAVLTDLSLASQLKDGDAVRVPEKAIAASQVKQTSPKRSRTRQSAKPAEGQKVDLNRASLEQLDSLPGIGRSIAQDILRYRQSKGRFRTLDELKEVPGIGDRRFERLKGLLIL